MKYRLHRRQVIEAGMEQVFDFFKDPQNLESITPPWLGFRVLETSDAEVQAGSRLAYRMRIYGVPFRWEARIPEYVPGVSFADEMVRGPYRRWYHRHLFRRVRAGVEMEDFIEYELPLGPLGTLAHHLFVRRQVNAIFDYRAHRITERFHHAAARRRTPAIKPA
jgi:ligand-binding SRPBCC domain-containing protein